MPEIIDFQYTAPGPVAAAFIKDMHPMTFISGPVGSGKSVSLLMKAFTCGLKQRPGEINPKRRTRWAVIRNTREQLKDTTIVTAREWFEPMAPNGWREGERKFILSFGEYEMEFIFRPLDEQEDVKRVLSLEVTGMILNECREIPITLLSDLFGRCGRFPPERDVPDGYKLLFGDTNAPFEGTDWQQAFNRQPLAVLGNEVLDAHFYKQPSGMSPRAENKHNLNSRYYEDLIKFNTKDWAKQYVHNEYGKNLDERYIFANSYDEQKHVPETDIEPDFDFPVVIGLDLGLTPSAVFMQPNVYRGCIDVIDELTGEDIGLYRFVKELLIPKLATEYPSHNFVIVPDPAGAARDQNFESKAHDILAKTFGFAVFTGHTNDPTTRINLMLAFLNKKDYVRVSPKCTQLRLAMRDVKYPKASKNGVIVTKKVVKTAFNKDEFSHVVEACGYGFQAIASGVNLKDMAKRYKDQFDQELISEYNPLYQEPVIEQVVFDEYTGY